MKLVVADDRDPQKNRRHARQQQQRTGQQTVVSGTTGPGRRAGNSRGDDWMEIPVAAHGFRPAVAVQRAGRPFVSALRRREEDLHRPQRVLPGRRDRHRGAGDQAAPVGQRYDVYELCAASSSSQLFWGPIIFSVNTFFQLSVRPHFGVYLTVFFLRRSISTTALSYSVVKAVVEMKTEREALSSVSCSQPSS